MSLTLDELAEIVDYNSGGWIKPEACARIARAVADELLAELWRRMETREGEDLIVLTEVRRDLLGPQQEERTT